MNLLKRLVVPIAGTLLLFGCASTGERLTDQTCVMMPGEPVTSDSRSAEFEGETVRFCCKSCARKWDKASDAEKSQLVADMKAYLAK